MGFNNNSTPDIVNVGVQQDVFDAYKADNSLQSDIKGTNQSVTLNTGGDVIKVQHINGSSVVLREDIFTYATNLITEVRTIIASGLTITYLYHTDTLTTEVI